MRERTEGGMVTGNPVKIFATDERGVKTQTGTLPGVRTGFFNTMSDTVVENYRARVAKGEVFFNHMSSKKRRVMSNSQGYIQQAKTKADPAAPYLKQVEVSGNWLDVYVPVSGTDRDYMFTDLIPSSLVQDMRNEVSTKVSSDRGLGPSNLWESVAETHQMIDMLEGFNTQVTQLLAQAFHRAGPLGLLTLPASAWLAFRYGLKPAYSDLLQIFNGLTNARGAKKRKTTRSSLTESRTERLSFSAQGSGSIANHYSVVRKHDITVRGMSLDEYVASIGTEIGLTFKGLTTVPWDLLYMSFVADWFINLGDFLRSYAPAVGFTQLGSCLVTTRQNTETWTCDGSSDGANYTVVRPISGNFVAEYESKDRSALLSPSLGIKTDFRFDKATRVGDALALTGLTMLKIWPQLKNAVRSRTSYTE